MADLTHIHRGILKNATRQISGFSLTELMVTLGISACLAAVAVPNYLKFAAKAKQAEAKNVLPAMYAVQIAFRAETGSFTYCLEQLGFETEPGAKRYYGAGYFQGIATESTCGDGTQSCFYYNFSTSTSCGCGAGNKIAWGGSQRNDCGFWHNQSVDTTLWPIPDGTTTMGPYLPNLAPYQCRATGTTFRLCAIGKISGGGDATNPYLDVWSINENRVLVHDVSAF